MAQVDPQNLDVAITPGVHLGASFGKLLPERWLVKQYGTEGGNNQ